MKAKSTTNRHTGFSTLEILLAFALVILTMTAVISLIFGSQVFAVDSQTDSEATHKAQAMLETARATARQNFSLVVAIPTVTDDIYQKTLAVQDIDSYTKQVTATVTWDGGRNRNLSVQLATYITDPTAAAGGDTCSPTLTGDWTNPQLLGSADVGQNNGGTDVDVLGKKAYVTADAASAGKPDFYIIDVSDPNISNLPILGSVDTGPGLAAVHVNGKYAFVADMSTTAQLQVIDISNPAAPSVVASLDVTSAGDTAVGNSIFYSNKRVYLGLTKSTGPEFYVIDVSNPTNLSASSIKATFETNSAINAITVKNGTAYLAVPDDTSTGAITEQLRILNVSNADAGTITPYASFGPNPNTMSGEGLYISKDGTTLYLGEGGANPSNKPEFFSLNVTNPASISVINSKYIPTGGSITVNAMTVRSNLAFLWTSDPNLGFQIWDLNNLGSGTPYGSLNTQQNATGGFDCDGNYLYTAQRSQKAFQIIGPGSVNAYTLSNGGDIAVVQGLSGITTVTRTLVSGNPSVTLTASGLPAGATATFTSNPCVPTCSSQLTISTTFPTTPVGTYPITITGTGGMTTSLNLVVSTQPFDYTLTNSGSVTVVRGSAVNTTVTRTLVSGATTGITLAASGLPAGATAAYTTNPCSPTCSSTVTITTTAATPLGTFPITITGTPPGTGPRTTTFNLVVNAPFDYTLSNSGNISVKQKNSAANTITRTLVSGVSVGVTLSVTSVLPSGVTATFTNNPCTATCSSTLTLSTKNNTPIGTTSVTVTGSPNGIGPRTTTFTLTVTP